MGKRGWQVTFFLPLAVLYLWLIGGGLYRIFLESLGYIPVLGMTEISLRHYVAALGADGFFRDLLYTLYIALTASTLSVMGGTYLAFRLVRSKKSWVKAIIQKVMQMGLVLPYLYMVFIISLMFGRTGIYSRLLYSLGIIGGLESFPILVQDPVGIGVLMVFVFKGIPFVTLFLLNIMSGISETYEQVASSNGATPLQILRRVYIPLCSDTIVWALMILLAYDIGAFEVPYLLGSLKPQSLSVRLFGAYMSPSIDTVPATMAIAVILFIFGFLVVVLYGFAMKKLLMSRHLLMFKRRPSTGHKLEKVSSFLIVTGIIIGAVLPAIYMILLSFNNYFRYPSLVPSKITTSYWQNLLVHNTLFAGSILSSLVVAGTTAILATIIGFMAGRGIVLHFRHISTRMLLIVSLPLFIPGMSLFLGAHQALIHTVFANSWTGVILAHLLICIPYTTNIAVAYFKGIPLELEQAAKNLGAEWPTSMLRLILPMIMPGLSLSLMVAFLISNTEYFATFLVGGGNTITLSMIMYPYIANSDYGMGTATGIVFILLHLLVFLLLDKVLNKRNRNNALYGSE